MLSTWFLTAPWQPAAARRGDALGFRAFADDLADRVTPGFTNRVRDARWITILSWCLLRSHHVWRKAGHTSLSSREDQRRRYAWLRPLELLWVARTIQLADGSGARRQLAGRQRVTRWVADPDEGEFGLSADQYARYRQTGMYGGYRVALRRLDGLTLDADGWRPGPAALKLARWLDEALGEAGARHSLEHVPQAPKAKYRGREHAYWSGFAWTSWGTAARPRKPATREYDLPRPWDDLSKLPEASLVQPVVFGEGDGVRRRKVVGLLRGTKTHLGACERIADGLAGEADGARVAALPWFSSLADSGMRVLQTAWECLGNDARVSLRTVIARATDDLGALDEAAARWRRERKRFDLPAEAAKPVDLLADSLGRSLSKKARILALLEHHRAHGSGLRWFTTSGDALHLVAPHRASDAALYRFRLWPLCRIALQTGTVLKTIPAGIDADPGAAQYRSDED